jgi:hypothetical protein
MYLSVFLRFSRKHAGREQSHRSAARISIVGIARARPQACFYGLVLCCTVAALAAMVTPADKERPHHRFRIGRVFQIHFAKQV